MLTKTHSDRLAPNRTNPEPFEHGLAHVARRMLFGALSLNQHERQMLHDIARTEGRYAMKTLQALIAIAPRCVRPEDQDALPEFIRGRIAMQRARIGCPLTAFALETEAQCVTDIAQWRFARTPNHATKQEVLAALQQQQAATRLSIDTLLVA